MFTFLHFGVNKIPKLLSYLYIELFLDVDVRLYSVYVVLQSQISWFTVLSYTLVVLCQQQRRAGSDGAAG